MVFEDSTTFFECYYPLGNLLETFSYYAWWYQQFLFSSLEGI